MQSLSEFCEYLRSNPPHAIVYLSDNQDEEDQSETLSLQLTFSYVDVFENPNTVKLSNRDSSMTFYGVNGVDIYENPPSAGYNVVRLCCDSTDGGKNYTLVIK